MFNLPQHNFCVEVSNRTEYKSFYDYLIKDGYTNYYPSKEAGNELYFIVYSKEKRFLTEDYKRNHNTYISYSDIIIKKPFSTFPNFNFKARFENHNDLLKFTAYLTEEQGFAQNISFHEDIYIDVDVRSKTYLTYCLESCFVDEELPEIEVSSKILFLYNEPETIEVDGQKYYIHDIKKLKPVKNDV